MKKLLYILLLITCSCDKPQSITLCQALGNCKTPSLIIFSGESNSGGKAENSQATSHELDVRQNVKILNNNSLLFESLDIPINNIIGHAGYPVSESIHQHGWELGLANNVDSGKLPNPTYIVKTGQGGSCIANWSITGATGYRYWDSLTKRVDKAKALLMKIGSRPPKMYLFYSQGINDIYVCKTDMYVWKAATKTHFSNIRARYGFMPIFMTLLPTNYFSAYNPVILEIANEMSDCYAIQTSDAEVIDAHWTYAGQKLIVGRMIQTLKAHYNY